MNRPCAVPGLHSYRYRLPHGVVMIGARNDLDAMREARRSVDTAWPWHLETWNGEKYVRAQNSC